MREILFRGKSVEQRNSGRWIEGSLVTLDDTHIFIVPRFESASTMSSAYIVYSTIEAVDPSTVGQYTGITDRKGNRIFEGDHVKLYYRNDNNEFEPVSVGTILFFSGSFRLKTMRFLEPFPTTQYTQYEVVGNVADNGEYPL